MSVVEVGQYFVTRSASEFLLFTVACREYTHSSRWSSFSTKRMDPRKHENWTYLGSHNELSALQIRSRSSNSVCERRQFSVLGQNFLRYSSLCEQLHQVRHEKSCRYTRRGICTNKLRSGCSQIESKSKTSTERVYWHNDHPIKWKSMGWHWTIKARSRVAQFVEESHQSSSTQSEITSRARWINPILQNQIPSKRLSSSNTKLVWWSMVSLFGCRRRIQTKISVLLWLLGINHLSPCSSRTFWGQSHWSCAAGPRVDRTWSISLHLPCRKQFQYFFNSQQWIDTWRPKFKQKTVCVLLACWSKRRKSRRTRKHWLLCTASCPICTKQLEKASGYGILDWYWSWNYQRRIVVLSDKIERNHPSGGTSSKLHCESWKIEKRRTIVQKTIFVASSTTKDLFEARSQLE